MKCLLLMLQILIRTCVGSPNGEFSPYYSFNSQPSTDHADIVYDIDTGRGDYQDTLADVFPTFDDGKKQKKQNRKKKVRDERVLNTHKRSEGETKTKPTRAHSIIFGQRPLRRYHHNVKDKVSLNDLIRDSRVLSGQGVSDVEYGVRLGRSRFGGSAKAFGRNNGHQQMKKLYRVKRASSKPVDIKSKNDYLKRINKKLTLLSKMSKSQRSKFLDKVNEHSDVNYNSSSEMEKRARLRKKLDELIERKFSKLNKRARRKSSVIASKTSNKTKKRNAVKKNIKPSNQRRKNSNLSKKSTSLRRNKISKGPKVKDIGGILKIRVPPRWIKKQTKKNSWVYKNFKKPWIKLKKSKSPLFHSQKMKNSKAKLLKLKDKKKKKLHLKRRSNDLKERKRKNKLHTHLKKTGNQRTKKKKKKMNARLVTRENIKQNKKYEVRGELNSTKRRVKNNLMRTAKSATSVAEKSVKTSEVKSNLKKNIKPVMKNGGKPAMLPVPSGKPVVKEKKPVVISNDKFATTSDKKSSVLMKSVMAANEGKPATMSSEEAKPSIKASDEGKLSAITEAEESVLIPDDEKLNVMREEKSEPLTEDKQDSLTQEKPLVVTEDTSEVMPEAELVGKEKSEIIGEGKPEIMTEDKTEGMSKNKPDISTEDKPEITDENKPEIMTEDKPAIMIEETPGLMGDEKSEAAIEEKPEALNKEKGEVMPEAKQEVLNDEKREFLRKNEKSEVLNDLKPDLITDLKPELMTDLKPESMTDLKPDLMTDLKPDLMTDSKPGLITDSKPDLITDSKQDLMTDSKPDLMTDLKPDLMTDLKPDLVNDLKPDLMNDLKPDLMNDLKPDLVNDLKPDLMNDLKPDLVNDLKPDSIYDFNHGMKNGLKTKLTNDRKPEAINDLKSEVINDLKPMSYSKSEIANEEISEDAEAEDKPEMRIENKQENDLITKSIKNAYETSAPMLRNKHVNEGVNKLVERTHGNTRKGMKYGLTSEMNQESRPVRISKIMPGSETSNYAGKTLKKRQGNDIKVKKYGKLGRKTGSKIIAMKKQNFETDQEGKQLDFIPESKVDHTEIDSNDDQNYKAMQNQAKRSYQEEIEKSVENIKNNLYRNYISKHASELEKHGIRRDGEGEAANPMLELRRRMELAELPSAERYKLEERGLSLKAELRNKMLEEILRDVDRQLMLYGTRIYRISQRAPEIADITPFSAQLKMNSPQTFSPLLGAKKKSAMAISDEKMESAGEAQRESSTIEFKQKHLQDMPQETENRDNWEVDNSISTKVHNIQDSISRITNEDSEDTESSRPTNIPKKDSKGPKSRAISLQDMKKAKKLEKENLEMPDEDMKAIILKHEGNADKTSGTKRIVQQLGKGKDAEMEEDIFPDEGGVSSEENDSLMERSNKHSAKKSVYDSKESSLLEPFDESKPSGDMVFINESPRDLMSETTLDNSGLAMDKNSDFFENSLENGGLEAMNSNESPMTSGDEHETIVEDQDLIEGPYRGGERYLNPDEENDNAEMTGLTGDSLKAEGVVDEGIDGDGFSSGSADVFIPEVGNEGAVTEGGWQSMDQSSDMEIQPYGYSRDESDTVGDVHDDLQQSDSIISKSGDSSIPDTVPEFHDYAGAQEVNRQALDPSWRQTEQTERRRKKKKRSIRLPADHSSKS